MPSLVFNPESSASVRFLSSVDRDLSIAVSEIQTIVSSAGDDIVAIPGRADRVYRRYSPATVDFSAHVIASRQGDWRILDDAGASIVAGLVSDPNNGARREITIAVDYRGIARTKKVFVGRSSGQTTTVFDRFADGSFGKASADALAAAKLNGTDLRLLTAIDVASKTYARNPDFYLRNYPTGGMSIASHDGTEYRHTVTMLSRDCGICAAHFPLLFGGADFLGIDGEVYSRSRVDGRYLGEDGTVYTTPELYTLPSGTPISDLMIVKIDEQIPDEVNFFKVFPADYATRISMGGANLPVIVFHQDLRASLWESLAISQNVFAYAGYLFLKYIAGDYARPIISGDSSRPAFVPGETELIFAGSNFFPGMNPSPIPKHNAINEAMGAMGSAHTLTDYNLAGYSAA